jgi:hypothetical protein
MPTIHKREAATRDLVEHFVYLAGILTLPTSARGV